MTAQILLEFHVEIVMALFLWPIPLDAEPLLFLVWLHIVERKS